MRISNSFSFKNHEKKSLCGSFLRARRGTFCREPARALLSAAQPHTRTAATPRIAPALPRRAPSCVGRLSFFCQWRFHVATSLRKARGANSNRRKLGESDTTYPAVSVVVVVLHNKNPPTPCLWQAPASTQKTKRKTRPAIRRSARWRVVPAVSGGGGGAENRNAPNDTAALVFFFFENPEAARNFPLWL